MADKEILQRGTVPTTNAKGKRVASRPMNDGDREAIDRQAAGMMGRAQAGSIFTRANSERERALGPDGTYSEPGNSGSSTANR